MAAREVEVDFIRKSSLEEKVTGTYLQLGEYLEIRVDGELVLVVHGDGSVTHVE
jgi:hypothetical protein